MESTKRIFQAYLDEMTIITILLPLSYHNGQSSSFSLICGAEKSPLNIIDKILIENYLKYTCRFADEICFGKEYVIADDHGGRTDLQIGAVIRTEAFDNKFFYEGNDLGVTYQRDRSQIKLWAPTATQVKLKLRHPATQYAEIIKMKLGDRGVWCLDINRDLELYQYSFLVQVNKTWREAVDPYAKAVSANGEHGVIVSLEKTARPKVELPPMTSPVEAIIYEAHVRDFTIHPESGVKNKGLYLGAGELNTKGVDGEPTGLSYVKELGITHLELLPFHDFAGVDEWNPDKEYNWGYNPLHFNAPEGSYSTNPSDPYSRISELKDLIDQIHRVGLRVIMDVVYNHVYIREESSFEKIVPGYYFRHNEIGLPANGTGVGNDIASERKMVRKFIVDSIRYWLEEYHVDGFRFDLMGILDVETMNEVKKVCDSLSKGIIILGEGWNLNTPLPFQKKAIIANQAKLPDIAQFNDQFRDTIKGSTFNILDKGYALGNKQYLEAAFEMITGSIGLRAKGAGIFNEPVQSVNYVECHDNHTLWDKLQSCLPDVDDAVRMRYHRLATGIVLLAQGIPFLHSGQEFFRTKQGEGNSYQSPDSINQLDWNRKSQFKENVDYIKGLIQIRKEYPCFRLRTAAEIRNQLSRLPLPSPILGCSFQQGDSVVILITNPSLTPHKVSIPNGEWSVLADRDTAGIMAKKVFQGAEIQVEPISLNVLVKK